MTGSSTSPARQKTITDFLGRTVQIESEGYNGTEVTSHFYNANGWLVRTSAPGVADTLYEYNQLGEILRSGLDVNGNGILEAAGRRTGQLPL